MFCICRKVERKILIWKSDHGWLRTPPLITRKRGLMNDERFCTSILYEMLITRSLQLCWELLYVQWKMNPAWPVQKCSQCTRIPAESVLFMTAVRVFVKTRQTLRMLVSLVIHWCIEYGWECSSMEFCLCLRSEKAKVVVKPRFWLKVFRS